MGRPEFSEITGFAAINMTTLEREDQGMLLELSVIELELRTKTLTRFQKGLGSFLLAIQKLLKRYERVFNSRGELPPVRTHDHSIELQSGIGPVNVRPYRYPQFQKDEIERLVQDMLWQELFNQAEVRFLA